MTVSYEKEMRRGETEYSDVLVKLKLHGYQAVFTQTGGMCFGIQVEIDAERYALITDTESPLAAYRDIHKGWSVGTYEIEDSSEPVRIVSTEDGSLDGLFILIQMILGGHPEINGQ